MVLQRFKPFIYYISLILVLGYYIVRAITAPYSDFAGYYFGSEALLHGDYTNVYDNYSFNVLIAQRGYKEIFASYMPFPPFTALVIAPLLLLKLMWAKVAFNVISCLLLLFTLHRTVKFFAFSNWLVVVLPVLFFIPLRNGIFFGQAYLLLLVLLLEGYMAYKKEQLGLSSFLWAVAILFKLFPGVILIFLLVKRQYKHAIYLCAASLVLMFLSLWLNGFAVWKFYLTIILPWLNNGELNGTFTHMFQSFFMLLRNIFVYDELVNPSPFFNSPTVFAVLLALFKAFILGVCIRVTWKKNTSDLLSFALWITASSLISPNGSSYSLVLLIIPFLAILHESAQMNERQKTIFIVSAAVLLLLICSIPVQSLASWPVVLKFPRLYLLLIFWFLLMKQSSGAFDYRVTLLLFIALMVPEIIKLNSAGQSESNYLLLKDEHILLYDYGVKDHKLVYYYWDNSGSNEVTADYSLDSISAKDVSLQQNQIWYKGKQLTHTADWKKKPMLVNGTIIIFLGDKNRGVSFYTLRKIEL